MMISGKNYFLICASSLVLLLMLVGGIENQPLANSEEVNRINICEIPEDISAFKTLIENRVGLEITGSDIKLLQDELGLEVTEDKETVDALYSVSVSEGRLISDATKKVRLVGLTKRCIASDQVPYAFHVGILTDLAGNAIANQAYLIYEHEFILNGKREFSFPNVFASSSEYARLISKKTVGIMDKAQLDSYMQSLGCSKLESVNKDVASAAYAYIIDGVKDLGSRLAGWNFSKRILVDFNTEGVVSNIRVTSYNVPRHIHDKKMKEYIRKHHPEVRYFNNERIK